MGHTRRTQGSPSVCGDNGCGSKQLSPQPRVHWVSPGLIRRPCVLSYGNAKPLLRGEPGLQQTPPEPVNSMLQVQLAKKGVGAKAKANAKQRSGLRVKKLAAQKAKAAAGFRRSKTSKWIKEAAERYKKCAKATASAKSSGSQKEVSECLSKAKSNATSKVAKVTKASAKVSAKAKVCPKSKAQAKARASAAPSAKDCCGGSTVDCGRESPNHNSSICAGYAYNSCSDCGRSYAKHVHIAADVAEHYTLWCT